MCRINFTSETNFEVEKLLFDFTPDSKDNFDLDWTTMLGLDSSMPLEFSNQLTPPLSTLSSPEIPQIKFIPSIKSLDSIKPLQLDPIHPIHFSSTASQKRAAEQFEPETVESKKKRKQNEAAQRCRQRKADQIQYYQDTIKKLEDEKFEMSVQIAVLTQEKEAFNAREADMQKTLNDLKELVNFNRALNCSL